MGRSPEDPASIFGIKRCLQRMLMPFACDHALLPLTEWVPRRGPDDCALSSPAAAARLSPASALRQYAMVTSTCGVEVVIVQRRGAQRYPRHLQRAPTRAKSHVPRLLSPLSQDDAFAPAALGARAVTCCGPTAAIQNNSSSTTRSSQRRPGRFENLEA